MMKKILKAIPAVVLTAAMILSAAPAVQADEQTSETLNASAATVADGFYKIGSILQGYSLDVDGGRLTDGANVQVYQPNGTSAQIWRITSANGISTITSYASGKVLDVTSAGTTDGTNVQQWTANGTAAQQWKIENDAGYCRFINVNSGKALTISGSNAQIGTADSSKDQRFLLTPVDINSTGFTVDDLTSACSYTGSAVEPALSIHSETTLKTDVATVESRPGHYITGGLNIPQLYIGSHYCGPSCMAMVLSYLRGIPTSIDEVTSLWPGYVQNLAELTKRAAAYYGVGNVEISGPNGGVGVTPDISLVTAALKAGRPVISLQQNGGIFTFGDHYIVLRGVTQDGMFLVNDPSGNTQNAASDPSLSYDSEIFENTLFTADQIMAHCSEFYIFDAKSANANYTNSINIGTAKNASYSVTYSDNVEPGIAEATVTGSGDVSGTVVKKFAIVDTGLEIENGGVYCLFAGSNAVKAVDVEGGSDADSANVQIYDSNMTYAQFWIFFKNADGTWKIENYGSGKVLDVAHGSISDGGNVQQYHSNDTEAQKWNLTKNSDGSYTIASVKSGKALDIAGGSKANGGNVQIYSPNGTAAQKFYAVSTGIRVADAEAHQIVSALNSSRVIDISGGSKDDRANAQLWTGNGTAAQQFRFEYEGNGYCRIVNAGSGLVLDVAGGLAQAGTNVQQYTWNGTKAQLWKIGINEDNTYTFYSALGSSLVLDVTGGSDSEGANLQIYTANSTNAQKWKLSG